jgi:hypothetical protein
VIACDTTLTTLTEAVFRKIPQTRGSAALNSQISHTLGSSLAYNFGGLSVPEYVYHHNVKEGLLGMHRHHSLPLW